MRALCGAIITAGALIGLGMTAIGFGTRYQTQDYNKQVNEGQAAEVTPLHLHQMDRPLVFMLVFLTTAAVIGMGITFVGLAYHHHRRHHEHLRLHSGATTGTHVTT